MKIQKILQAMIEYDRGDVYRIQHFVKVYGFAHMQGIMEGMSGKELEILDIAAILHDIGIHPAEAKYNSDAGKYQEELGPDEARRLLAPFDLEEDVVDRVCFLIGHHHTYSGVDGLDWQIILESDFLVNSFEQELSQETIREVEKRVFKTESGKRALEEMFALS